MCFPQEGGRRNLGRGPVRQRMNDRGGEQKCKAVANRLRKIRRVPAERILLTPSRAHATPQSNASFETKHRPPAAFLELLSFTQRRATNVTLRELNRARCGSVVAAVSIERVVGSRRFRCARIKNSRIRAGSSGSACRFH